MIIYDFIPNTIIENTDCLVSYLPNGKIFAAKNIEGTNLRKLYTAFSQEFYRLQDKIYEISNEDDLENTTNLIDEWESALGIPDSCFSNVGTSIQQRRKQIVAKFAKMNITTEQDWIDLAKFFGYDIEIIHPIANSGFDYTFDFYFFDNKTARFTMIIKFLNIPQPEDVFDCTFDFTFSDNNNVVICLFEHLKPANVQLIYEYEL